MNAPNQTLPDDELRQLGTIVRCLTVARGLCVASSPTPGMVALAGQAMSIAERFAVELLRRAEKPGSGFR